MIADNVRLNRLGWREMVYRSKLLTLAACVFGMLTVLLVPAGSQAVAAPAFTVKIVKSPGFIQAHARCPKSVPKAIGGGYYSADSRGAAASMPVSGGWDLVSIGYYGPDAFAVCIKGDITVSTRSQSLPANYAITLDCPDASPLAIAGGFEGTFLPNGVSMTQSYPNGTQSWTFKALTPGRNRRSGRAFLVCGRSNTLSTTIVSAPLRNGKATPRCPAQMSAVGGGISSGSVIASDHSNGTASWFGRARKKSAKGTAYAVCLGSNEDSGA
jgi:hypothetical protein